jgi:hypothetical protein
MEMYHGDEDFIESERAYDAECSWNLQGDSSYYYLLEDTKINNDPQWAA